MLFNRFIQKDSSIITVEEAERNELAKVNRMLYKGKQTDVYLQDYLHRIELGGSKLEGKEGLISFQSETAQNFFRSILQGVNITTPIIKTYAGLLFGQDTKISSTDEIQNEWLNGKRNGQESFAKYAIKKFYAAAIEAGLTGNGVMEVYSELDNNGQPRAKIAIVPAENWYPIVSEKDPSEIIANAIVYSYKLKDNTYINRVVIYANGYNLYTAVETKNGKIEKVLDWKQYENIIGKLPDEIEDFIEEEGIPNIYKYDTGLSYSMCQVFMNDIKDSNSPFGNPTILPSTRTMERELCVRKTQNGRVLDKNSDPILTVPESTVEETKSGKPYVNLSGKTIAINKDYDIQPAYVEWNGGLAESRAEIVDTIDAVMKETRMAGELLGSSAGTGVLTGEALYRKMTATLAELGTKKMLCELAIENIIKCCWQLENEGAEDIDCTIEFAKGLPQSETEKIDNILKKNGNEAIISLEDSIREMYPSISEKELQVTIQKIREQKGLDNSLTNSPELI